MLTEKAREFASENNKGVVTTFRSRWMSWTPARGADKTDETPAQGGSVSSVSADPVDQILNAARRLGVTLSTDGEAIHVSPADRLPPYLQAPIEDRKLQLIERLQLQCRVCGDEVAAYSSDGTPLCERHDLPLVHAAAAAGGRVLSDAEARTRGVRPRGVSQTVT